MTSTIYPGKNEEQMMSELSQKEKFDQLVLDFVKNELEEAVAEASEEWRMTRGSYIALIDLDDGHNGSISHMAERHWNLGCSGIKVRIPYLESGEYGAAEEDLFWDWADSAFDVTMPN